MNKYLIILILMIIFGCGEAPSSNSLPAVTPVPVTNEGDSTGEVIQSSNGQSARLVYSSDDLPACGVPEKGSLMYVRDVEMFFVCEDLMWNIVDIKGKDGANGVNGIDGKDGKNGKDGIVGQAGQDGVNGKDGKNGVTVGVEPTVWIHPVKGVRWFVGRPINSFYYSNQTPNLMTPNFICPVGSRSPTEAEYLDALASGIWLKFSAYAPLFIKLGAYTNGQEVSSGIFLYTYKIRAANSVNGIIDYTTLGSNWGTANALCIAIDQ